MKTAHFATLITLVCTSTLAACTSPEAVEPEPQASAQAEIKGAYGYEFFAERPGASEARAAAIPAEVKGRLAPEVVLDVVRTGHPELARCERTATGRGEALPAEVRARLVIGQDGRVMRVTTGDAPAELGACFQRAFGALVFPRSTGGSFEAVVPVLLGHGS